jgi:hypothetical protein
MYNGVPDEHVKVITDRFRNYMSTIVQAIKTHDFSVPPPLFFTVKNQKTSDSLEKEKNTAIRMTVTFYMGAESLCRCR